MVVEIELELTDGTTRTVTSDEAFSWVPETKRNRIPGQLLRLSPVQRADVLREVEILPDLKEEVRTLRVFRVVYATDPDAPRRLERTELAEVDLG